MGPIHGAGPAPGRPERSAPERRQETGRVEDGDVEAQARRDPGGGREGQPGRGEERAVGRHEHLRGGTVGDDLAARA